jgi:hypothetical protein
LTEGGGLGVDELAEGVIDQIVGKDGADDVERRTAVDRPDRAVETRDVLVVEEPGAGARVVKAGEPSEMVIGAGRFARYAGSARLIQGLSTTLVTSFCSSLKIL